MKWTYLLKRYIKYALRTNYHAQSLASEYRQRPRLLPASRIYYWLHLVFPSKHNTLTSLCISATTTSNPCLLLHFINVPLDMNGDTRNEFDSASNIPSKGRMRSWWASDRHPRASRQKDFVIEPFPRNQYWKANKGNLHDELCLSSPT